MWSDVNRYCTNEATCDVARYEIEVTSKKLRGLAPGLRAVAEGAPKNEDETAYDPAC